MESAAPRYLQPPLIVCVVELSPSLQGIPSLLHDNDTDEQQTKTKTILWNV